MLTEIRWHGRGGQGVVTVSRLLAEAALLDGKYVQAFPEFGPERLGAPILGFTRISDEPIDSHSQVYTPDIIVVLDPTLLKDKDLFRGLIKDGTALINLDKSPLELKRKLGLSGVKVYTVDATQIALDILGRPIYNTAMLGGLVRISELATLESVKEATLKRFGEKIGRRNVAVIERSIREVKGV